MGVLARLTPAERDALWWDIYKAAREATTEIWRLARLSPDARTLLYGARALEMMQGMADDLIDLLDHDLRPAPAGPSPEGITHGPIQL